LFGGISEQRFPCRYASGCIAAIAFFVRFIGR
jgi:hypothetical protein